MGVCYCLEFLWVPERILLFSIFEVWGFYEIIEIFKCMFKAIFENRCIPIVRSPVISVYHVNQYSHFRFVSIIFDDFQDLCLRNIFILDGEATFNMLVHLFGHQIKSLNLRYEIH